MTSFMAWARGGGLRLCSLRLGGSDELDVARGQEGQVQINKAAVERFKCGFIVVRHLQTRSKRQ
jgi:hypothetical protein